MNNWKIRNQFYNGLFEGNIYLTNQSNIKLIFITIILLGKLIFWGLFFNIIRSLVTEKISEHKIFLTHIKKIKVS